MYNVGNFLGCLKQRNLVRVGVASLATARLVIASLAIALAVLPVAGGASAAPSGQEPGDDPAPAQSWGEAVQALEEKNWDAAIPYFQRQVSQRPNAFYAWLLLGEALHGRGDYREALPAHFLAAQYSQARGAAGFNAARSYARLGETQLSLLWVDRAIEAGFDDIGRLRTDADLEPVRSDQGFERILGRAARARGRVMREGHLNYPGPFDPAAGRVRVRTLGEILPSGTGGVAVAANGDIFVSDFGADLYRYSPGGERTLYLSGFEGASGKAFDSRGNMFQAHFGGQKISRITPAGEESVFASENFSGPVGIAIDDNDNLYVANCDGRSITRVTPDGTSAIFARSALFYCPNGITLAASGELYAANFHDGVITRIDAGGAVSYFAQIPGEGANDILYLNGWLYVTGAKSHRIYKLSMDGDRFVIAGSGQRGTVDGIGPEAAFSFSNGLDASPNGNCLYTNDRLGDWRGGADPDALPRSSILRVIQLDVDRPCG